MGKLLIQASGGGGIDPDELTVLSGDVRKGKIFGGSESDEPQTGTLEDRGAWTGSVGMNGSVTIPDGIHKSSKVNGPSVIQRGSLNKTLAINETYNLPEGYYTGGMVKQIVPTQGALSYTPNKATQTASVSGKYMTGNVTIHPIPANYFDINTGQTSFKNGVVASDGVFNGMKFIYVNDNRNSTPRYSYFQDAPIVVDNRVLSGIKGGWNITHNKSFNFTPFRMLRVTAVNYSNGQAQFNIRIVGADKTTIFKELTPWYEEIEKEKARDFTVDISGINQQAYVLFWWSNKYDQDPSNWNSRYINTIELLP